MTHSIRQALQAMYICRSCGAEVAYPQRFTKCPVCGINGITPPQPDPMGRANARARRPSCVPTRPAARHKAGSDDGGHTTPV